MGTWTTKSITTLDADNVTNPNLTAVIPATKVPKETSHIIMENLGSLRALFEVFGTLDDDGSQLASVAGPEFRLDPGEIEDFIMERRYAYRVKVEADEGVPLATLAATVSVRLDGGLT